LNNESILRASVDTASNEQESLFGDTLDLTPQPVGATQHRDVAAPFRISQSDDSRDAVRRAKIVTDVELLDAQHAGAALRDVVGRRAAHSADPDDDRVEYHGSFSR
jgi:hypothetical protein